MCFHAFKQIQCMEEKFDATKVVETRDNIGSHVGCDVGVNSSK